MKALNLKLDACVQCPYYKLELVLKDSGRGYDNLHACKKSARAIVYAEKVNRDNDPEDVIPKWCELPEDTKGENNGVQEAPSSKEERLSGLSSGSEELDRAIRTSSKTGGGGPG